MSDRAKPELSVHRANELLDEVRASDRRDARLAIANGVKAAQEKWIESSLIAEALVVELMGVVQNNNTKQTTAAYLRKLAESIAPADLEAYEPTRAQTSGGEFRH